MGAAFDLAKQGGAKKLAARNLRCYCPCTVSVKEKAGGKHKHTRQLKYTQLVLPSPVIKNNGSRDAVFIFKHSRKNFPARVTTSSPMYLNVACEDFIWHLMPASPRGKPEAGRSRRAEKSSPLPGGISYFHKNFPFPALKCSTLICTGKLARTAAIF